MASAAANALASLGSPSVRSGGRAIAAGVRAQADATLVRAALDLGGVLDERTAAAVDTVELAGRELVRGGAKVMGAGLLGRALDVVG